MAQATSELFEQKIYISNPSFSDLLFEQIKSGQMDANDNTHTLEGMQDDQNHSCFEHLVCFAGAGMNLTFDNRHLGHVPYDLLNYRLDSAPYVLASFDMEQKYHSLRVYADNRRDTPSLGLGLTFKQQIWSLIAAETESNSSTVSALPIVFVGATLSNPVPKVPSQPKPIQCDPGSRNENEYRCLSCGIGTYTPDPGLTSCISCPIGYYADEAGLAECKACPTGSTTWSKKRTHKSECMCEDGYYDAPNETTNHNYEWSQPAHTYVGCFQECGNATAGTSPCPSDPAADANTTARRASKLGEVVRKMVSYRLMHLC